MDNPQAFPNSWLQYSQQGFIVAGGHQEGMTLRDYFAGQAIIGLLSNSQLTNSLAQEMVTRKVSPDKEIAKGAYAYADAMLAQRKKV